MKTQELFILSDFIKVNITRKDVCPERTSRWPLSVALVDREVDWRVDLCLTISPSGGEVRAKLFVYFSLFSLVKLSNFKRFYLARMLRWWLEMFFFFYPVLSMPFLKAGLSRFKGCYACKRLNMWDVLIWKLRGLNFVVFLYSLYVTLSTFTWP